MNEYVKTFEQYSEADIWYHGSDNKYSEIKPSQLLKLDYPTEDGLWLTDNIHEAYMYGKYVTKYDVSELKILNRSHQNKFEFVIDYWVNKMGKDRKEIINSLKLEDEFKDLYDYAFYDVVEREGYDAVKLDGEFRKGKDLWVNIKGAKKLQKIE